MIESGRVVEVDAAVAPTRAEAMDGAGLALFPGLIDFQVHLWAPDGADLRPRRPS